MQFHLTRHLKYAFQQQRHHLTGPNAGFARLLWSVRLPSQVIFVCSPLNKNRRCLIPCGKFEYEQMKYYGMLCI
jgi:hypothetical protein